MRCIEHKIFQRAPILGQNQNVSWDDSDELGQVLKLRGRTKHPTFDLGKSCNME